MFLFFVHQERAHLGLYTESDDLFGPVLARNSEVRASTSSYNGCAYVYCSKLQRPGVCSAVYGTVYYKELP